MYSRTLTIGYTTNSVGYNTVGQFLIAWFNDCVLGKSGQIVNPIICEGQPLPYYSIHACFCHNNIILTIKYCL